MKRLGSILLLILLVGAVAFYFCAKNNYFFGNIGNSQTDSLSAYSTFDSCPPQGDAVSERAIDLNRFKNRYRFPQSSDFIDDISLAKILEPGNDKDRWPVDKAARIKGYVYEVKSGGVETCNCREREEPDKDTHIELVADPMQTGKIQRMIVEITPRMRDIMEHRGIDWSTEILRDQLLGRWIEVEGWLLFDDEHELNAENTNPGHPRNWRATAWEIHPITSIKLIDRPVP
jgi:hypothetical protein